MKNKLLSAFSIILATALLTGCGEDPALTKFRKSMDDFCTKVSEINTSINTIDATSEKAPDELLKCLDDLELIFKSFERLDFPEQFDYLEPIADEACAYMIQAVSGYHEAYSNGSYNEYTAANAAWSYECAYKRIQVIIAFLQGEEPEDVDFTIEYTDNGN